MLDIQKLYHQYDLAVTVTQLKLLYVFCIVERPLIAGGEDVIIRRKAECNYEPVDLIITFK